MDQLITDLEATLLRECRAGGNIDATKLAALCSSFKDLIQARLLEDLRSGKLEVSRGSVGGWYVGKRG